MKNPNPYDNHQIMFPAPRQIYGHDMVPVKVVFQVFVVALVVYRD